MGNINPGKGALNRASQSEAVTNAAALTAAAAAGATPTKAEFDALLADVTALRTKLNAALTALRTAGIVAP